MQACTGSMLVIRLAKVQALEHQKVWIMLCIAGIHLHATLTLQSPLSPLLESTQAVLKLHALQSKLTSLGHLTLPLPLIEHRAGPCCSASPSYHTHIHPPPPPQDRAPGRALLFSLSL